MTRLTKPVRGLALLYEKTVRRPLHRPMPSVVVLVTGLYCVKLYHVIVDISR